MAQFRTKVIEPVERMAIICRRLAQDGKRVRFVPTMGCLHDGHASLIRRAVEDPDDEEDVDVVGDNKKWASWPFGDIVVNDDDDDDDGDDNGHERTSGDPKRHVVVVSIFVNPKQFNNRDDFINYPKTLEADLEMCSRLKVDYVFVPRCEDIYGDATCSIKAPDKLANYLEGVGRPGHFEGMLTIVCKLFNIVRPERAYFGEKDYQQLILVRDMVEALRMQVRICQVETVRDPVDQLPLSSRNVRLSAKQRQMARVMYDILINAKDALESRPDDLEETIEASLLATQRLNSNMSSANGESSDKFKIDYLKLTCSKHLARIDYSTGMGLYDCEEGCVKKVFHNSQFVLKTRLLITVIVGDVRLLDNIEVELNKP